MADQLPHEITVLANGEQTGGNILALEVRMPPGGGRPVLHKHAPSEVYLVTSGEFAFYVGDLGTAPPAGHAFLRADLSSMTATSTLADSILSLTDRVDALVCCAGVLAMRPEWTAEGLERTFALNYLSRFLLTRRVEPALLSSASSRVALVANAGRYRDRLDLDDPHYRRGHPGLRVSTRSQFANDLLAVELAARYRGTPVAATCVFPGVVRTNVFRHGVGLPRAVVAVMEGVARRFGLTPEAAAETPAWLADSADPAQVSESFFGPARDMRRKPDRARRPERRTELWRVSEQLTAPWLTSATEAAASPAS